MDYGLRGKMLTSLTRSRFEELRQGISDGSLATRWKALEDKEPHELTRKQAVEFRQLSWLISLFETNPDALSDIVNDKGWLYIKVFDLGNGKAETVTFGRIGGKGR